MIEVIRLRHSDIVEKALVYAARMHDGQFRKKSNIPYIVHPIRVAMLTAFYGYGDDISQAVALLHDTVEDTSATIDDITDRFGIDIANGVYCLTECNDRQQYLDKIASSPEYVRIIKLCDTLDNVKTLKAMDPEGVERKFTECNSFYIPLARELCPDIATMITSYLESYAEHAKAINMTLVE